VIISQIFYLLIITVKPPQSENLEKYQKDPKRSSFHKKQEAASKSLKRENRCTMAPNVKYDATNGSGIIPSEAAKTMTKEEENIAMIQGALAVWGKN
jgi:hypothetical protein